MASHGERPPVRPPRSRHGPPWRPRARSPVRCHAGTLAAVLSRLRGRAGPSPLCRADARAGPPRAVLMSRKPWGRPCGRAAVRDRAGNGAAGPPDGAARAEIRAASNGAPGSRGEFAESGPLAAAVARGRADGRKIGPRPLAARFRGADGAAGRMGATGAASRAGGFYWRPRGVKKSVVRDGIAHDRGDRGGFRAAAGAGGAARAAGSRRNRWTWGGREPGSRGTGNRGAWGAGSLGPGAGRARDGRAAGPGDAGTRTRA